MAELDAYWEALPDDDPQKWEDFFRLYRRVSCPHLRSIGHGRVRCKLLRRIAVYWNRRSEHLAEIFYRKHPKARERENGWLIGDAVKECKINREGRDFEFPSDPRQPWNKETS